MTPAALHLSCRGHGHGHVHGHGPDPIPCNTRIPTEFVQGLLGAGSFGCVVAGRKTRGAGAGGQLVAIKIFEKNGIVAEEGGVERLRAEKEVRYGPDA